MASDDPSSDGSPDTPAAAFALFGHELRVEILLALWDAEGHAMSYAALQRAVGEADSGKFNYHLSKLAGRFVGKRDGEYELLYPGHRVVDAIASGVFHETDAVDPVALETDCHRCGAALTFTHDAFLGRVGCRDCGDVVLAFPFDPGGLSGRTDDEVVVAFDRRTRLFWRFALAGVCPVCAGVVETGLSTDVGPELDSHYTDDHPVVLAMDCRQCSFYNYPPAAVAALVHPAVAGWLYERGLDPRTTPAWAYDAVRDPGRLDVDPTEPLDVTVPLSAGDETLRVTMDESLVVTSLDRRPRRPDDGL